MAHFAKIENEIVVNVLVVDNEHESDGKKYLNDLGLEGTWVQTSYSAAFGGKFASIGDFYDAKKKLFISPIVEVEEIAAKEITE